MYELKFRLDKQKYYISQLAFCLTLAKVKQIKTSVYTKTEQKKTKLVSLPLQ